MNYPILYKRGTTDFNNNGKGVLSDAFDVVVKEVINDIFTLDFNYPMSSKLSHEIANGDIIKVNASKVLKNQKFRIMSITQNDDLTLSIHALHKSFDTATDYVKGPLSIEHGSCEYALNMLFNRSMKSQNYVGVSNIQNAQKFSCAGKQLGAAIIGSEGSLIDTYGLGAQIERDNSEVDKISILTRRGRDTNILIAYGKNITGYKCVLDEQSLGTVIVPIATDRDTQEKIIGPYVYAPNYADFDGELYIIEVDVTDRFGENEEITESALETKGRQYMEESKCNIPKFTYTVDFEKLDTSSLPLSYNLDKLYEVNIGDTIIIRHKIYNVNTQGRVSSIEYDPIEDKYTKIVIGDIRASFAAIVGPEGKPGTDGKTQYTWVKYADTPTSGMSDDPTGKAYLGLAYNKETKEESTNYADYTWSKIKGDDGNMGDFPDTIPEVPTLKAEVVGLTGIDLSWTFENKMYYTYELYASQVKDFTPSVFDKIFEGKASSYLHQVGPNENWYFRVRGVNSYNKPSGFSKQVHVSTNKQDSFDNYFSSVAIENLVADIFSVNYMKAGTIKGNWIDAKNLTVTDGNGHRTLDIDSFGRVSIMPTVFNLSVATETNVPTKDELNNTVATAKNELNTSINEVQSSVNDLQTYTDGAFKDELLTSDEKSAIKSLLSPLQTELAEMNKEYDSLYTNTDLLGTPKSNLKVSYDEYKAQHMKLVTTINDILQLSKITQDGKDKLTKAYTDHDYKLSVYRLRANEAVDSISSKKSADALSDAKEHTNSQISSMQNAVDDLKKYTDGAFKDNLITSDEKSTISGFLKPLKTELENISKEYTSIYNNNDLLGTSKTNLKESYDAYKTKYDELVRIINKLLESPKITTQDKTSLNNAYADHDTKLATYRQRVNEALDSIASKKSNDALSAAKSHANTQINKVQASVNDLKDYTNGAFKDSILTEDEKSKIEGYLRPLKSTFDSVTKEYTSIYSNADLVGASKTNLKNAYDSYKLKYDGLVNTIDSLLKLDSIIEANKIALDKVYTDHDTMLSTYQQRVNEALDSIASKKSNDSLNSAKTYTNAQIKVVNDTLNLKVSKDTYDANNKLLEERFTSLEQTDKDFQFKFQNTGAMNEVDDSNFGRGTSRWELVRSDIDVPAKIEYASNYSGKDIMCTNSAYIGDCSFDKSATWEQRIYPKNNMMTEFTLSGCYHYTDVRHGGGVQVPMANLYIEVHNKDKTIEYYNHSNFLDSGETNVAWKTVHQTYKRSNKPIDFIKLIVYKRNTTGILRITQIDLHENGLHRKWIPGGNEVNNHITTVDANGVKVDSAYTSQFARIDEEFVCIYNGGEAPINRQAFFGLENDIPTLLLGIHGINPGVSTFGGTHLGLKHYAPENAPYNWGGSWGMIEYKLDSGDTHISRIGLSQDGNVALLPHAATHCYKNVYVHGNSDYEISTSLGVFPTYMEDWGGVTAYLHGVKIYGHTVGSDNGSDIHFIRSTGGRSALHAHFVEMQTAETVYKLNPSLPKVYKSDAVVDLDLGEAVTTLLNNQQEQDSAIIANLLASVEMYEMLLETNPSISQNAKRKSRMSKIYVELLNYNEITIDEVPSCIVEEVKLLLSK